MLSEFQVREMLSECEALLGRRLVVLRNKLLRQRNPIEAVWELVNVHAALKVGRVTEEASAEPDIRLDLPGGDVVWIEATHVSPREQAAIDDVRTLPGWIRKQLAAAGVEPKLHVQLETATPGYRSDLTVPPRNRRRALMQSKGWRDFVADVLDRRIGSWRPSADFNVIVNVSPGSGLTSGYSGFAVPRRPEDHVVYRAIKSKASQIRRRSKRADQQPLVLSICASHPDTQVEPIGVNTTTVRQAVTAALADTRGWSMAALHNGIGPGHRKGLRVSGAEFVSAVVVTQLREPKGGWHPIFNYREALSQTFYNQQAGWALTPAVVDQLQRLHFNHYRYGPQWGEAWQGPLHHDEAQDQRRERDTGSITLSLGRDSVMSIEISTSLLLRLLSGRTTAKEAYSEYADDTWTRMQIAFSEGREIMKVDVLPGDPATRQTQRVKITLGNPVAPALAVRKSAT